MFSTLKTLMDGANARADDRLKDVYAIELIEQRIREADTNLSAAKVTLASLIQRKRSEEKLVATLDGRIKDLTTRASEALASKRNDLAEQAAQAIADMENERDLRRNTIDALETRISQLQLSIEAAHRRLVDLRQGAITARAVRREQKTQARLNKTFAGTSAADEAETLIRRVVDQSDPFEQSQILGEIERGLAGKDIAQTLEAEGFGSSTKSTAGSVLDRLKSND
ncbi:PspA/IM30 family protein [Rhodobacteraceae bacterium]|nr:PspA/IM30 family protein [Paracoccaceae bacterium]